jgi:xanthine dehydrogenase accessory factor
MMDSSLTELCRYFECARARGEPLVVATTIRTEGSTYRKAGARILISPDGSTSGMLSGGCLEADLLERAKRVLKNGRAERVVYNTIGSGDVIWGLGLGCEGVTEFWLQPACTKQGYEPLAYLQHCLQQNRSGSIATVVGGQALAGELGRHGYAGVGSDDRLAARLALIEAQAPRLEVISFLGRDLEVFAAPVKLPPALLLCGGGPDAVPVARLADTLGWRVTVIDHRPAFADPARFPAAARLISAPADELRARADLAMFDAAVIMSHHVDADIAYLRQIARQPMRYVGLLGPGSRRARLLKELGNAPGFLSAGIYGPAGLNIGADCPASIAIAIVAEIYSVLAGRRLGSGWNS